MPRPMRKYQVETKKELPIEFRQVNGNKRYYENGVLKTYANKTQAENKCTKLRALGYKVFYTFSHPYLILLDEDQSF